MLQKHFLRNIFEKHKLSIQINIQSNNSNQSLFILQISASMTFVIDNEQYPKHITISEETLQ